MAEVRNFLDNDESSVHNTILFTLNFIVIPHPTSYSINHFSRDRNTNQFFKNMSITLCISPTCASESSFVNKPSSSYIALKVSNVYQHIIHFLPGFAPRCHSKSTTVSADFGNWYIIGLRFSQKL